MANELDELYSSMDDSNKQLKTFQSVLAQNTRSTTILDDAFKSQAAAAKASKEAQEKLSKTISGTISGLTSFSKSLINGKGSFAPLSSVINLTTKALGGLVSKLPIVGKALKGLAEGAGEVANMMVEQFDKAYGTFEKLSDSGVVSGFEDMKTSARSMGLTMADQESLLLKRSKDMALFGGSAVRGREEFQKMAVASGDLREQFQRLGVSNQEFSDMQMSYLTREMQAGRGQKATTDQLIAGSAEYMKELDSISKLTGASRKDLLAEREARMGDARYRAGIATMPKELRAKFDKLADVTLASGAKGMSKMVLQLAASNGKATTQEQRDFITFMRGGGMDIQSAIQSIMDGSKTEDEVFKEMAIASEKAKEKFNDLGAVKGAETAATRFLVEGANMATKVGQETLQVTEEYAKKQAEIMADEDSENAKLAKTRQALYNSSVNIEQLATEGKLVTGSMNLMAQGIETITEKLYKMAGEDLPPYLKAKSDERKAIEKAKKAELELAKIEAETGEAASEDIMTVALGGMTDVNSAKQQRLEAARKKLEEALREKELAEAIRAKEDEKAGIGTANGPQNYGGSPKSGSSGGGGGSNVSLEMSGDYSGLNINNGKKVGDKYESVAGGPASAKIIDIARKFQGSYPGGVFTAFNDTLPSHKNTAHGKGLAFDYALPGVGSKQKIPKEMGAKMVSELRGMGASLAIDEYNNPSGAATGGHIHAQISARTGGIFSGPESGFLATLHGDEAVMDVGDNNVKQQALNTSLLGMGDTSKTNFSEVYKEMENKLDKLIDLMDMNVGNQRKQLKEKMG